MSDNQRSFQQLVMALGQMPAVTVHGAEYTGLYLSQLISVRYSPPAEAADDTPQLQVELGVIVAQAREQLDSVELDYRIWRDTTLFGVLNEIESAREAGFGSVCSPGFDAKGNPKPEKLPTRTDAESFLRTLAEYREHWDRQRAAQAAWSTLHLALEAARTRTHALNISMKWGTSPPEAASDNHRTTPGEGYAPVARDDAPTTGTTSAAPPPPPLIPDAAPKLPPPPGFRAE